MLDPKFDLRHDPCGCTWISGERGQLYAKRVKIIVCEAHLAALEDKKRRNQGKRRRRAGAGG